MSAVVFDEQLEIPLGIRTLRDFRKWMRTPKFPETGRVDYISGDVEVNVSRRDFFSHGGPVEAIARCLSAFIRLQKLGYLTIGQTRYVNSTAALSCEPDLMFVSYDSVQTARVCFVTEWKDDVDTCIEVEGAADLVVEIVSDSSVNKDTVRLPLAYFAAGVRE